MLTPMKSCQAVGQTSVPSSVTTFLKLVSTWNCPCTSSLMCLLNYTNVPKCMQFLRTLIFSRGKCWTPFLVQHAFPATELMELSNNRTDAFVDTVIGGILTKLSSERVVSRSGLSLIAVTELYISRCWWWRGLTP